jgi:hypothetical protein
MTLIVMKNRKVLNLPALQRVVLKSIYIPKNLTSTEITEMENSIVFWKESLEIKKNSGMMNAIDEENLEALQQIAYLIRENQEGNLDKRKESFARHGIDYRKFHGLQEAFTQEGFDRAAAMKKEYDKTHGEQEGLK